MGSFAKSVITGFAFSLGAALFRKVAPKLGLEDKANGKKDAEKAAASDDANTAERPADAPAARPVDAVRAYLSGLARRG